MEALEEIKQATAEVAKAKAAVEAAADSKVKKLEKELSALKYKLDTQVMNYLETNDRQYLDLTNENFDLLINDHIEFKVTQEDWGFFKSHATHLNGEVHDNGFFYAQTTDTDLALFNFQKGFYPLGYAGLVNYFGEADITITKRGFRLFGSRVPQRYIGSVDEQGNILMKTTDSYWEFDGNIYVNRIIGDFFSGNGAKREKFLSNKEKMKERIAEFIATIK